jgi:hypothetical protein
VARLAAIALLLALSPRPGHADIVTVEITDGAVPGVRHAGGSLALNGMGEARLAALSESLARLERAMARRKNPFYVPLDDDTDGDRRAVLDSSAPLAAAAMLAAGRWRSPEGELTIEAVTRCRRPSRCVRLGAGDRLPARHRFLAWPLGYAVIATAGSAPEADKLATRLRDGARQDGRIGLVLAAADLHRLRRSAAVDRLLRQARRLVAAAAGSSLARALAPLASANRVGDELPWLRLPPDAILVVPRLGALATADALLAEVRTVAPGAAWLSPP